MQQGVPEEYGLQCSQSHVALIAHIWTETRGRAFGYFYTHQHSHEHVYMCVGMCTKTSVVWLVLEAVADFWE